jgi:hypothetical protein
MKSDNNIKYHCCFCGKPIMTTASDPVHIQLNLTDGAAQGLAAHKKCLANVFHPSVPLGVEEIK